MTSSELFEAFIATLLIMIALKWISLKSKLPSSALLIVGGMGLAFVPGFPSIDLDPELILLILLPPLLMDGAYFTAIASFKRHISGVLLLAVGAVVFTTFFIGYVAHLLVPSLPWAACFVMGAIVSPPDAVSARATLSRVKLPHRITTLLEGESLLNDATSLVLFRFAVAAALSGGFSTKEATGTFVVLAVGGIMVGGGVASIWVYFLRNLRSDNLMVLASMILCWVAYIAGEKLHVSGVISTVSAGLIYGWYQHKIFNANVRVRATFFWKLMVLVLEALVFLLIGFSLKGVVDRAGGIDIIMSTMSVSVAALTLAVLASRFVWMFLTKLIATILHQIGVCSKPLNLRDSIILSWAGMRGVVTLAVSLTLPENFPGRDLMLITALAVILVTVMLQGSTLGLLIKLLSPKEEVYKKLDKFSIRKIIALAEIEELNHIRNKPTSSNVIRQVVDNYKVRITNAQEKSKLLTVIDNSIQLDIFESTIQAGRQKLLQLHSTGMISDDDMHFIERELDLEELYQFPE